MSFIKEIVDLYSSSSVCIQNAYKYFTPKIVSEDFRKTFLILQKTQQA